MNPIIYDHFNAIEAWLLQSPVVILYKIISKEVAPTDGKFRVKVNFVNESMAELFEYVTVSGTDLNLSKYSFHWQDKHGTLKCRWDNAPHHPELPHAPHHKHQADQSVIPVTKIQNIFDVLVEIEKTL